MAEIHGMEYSNLMDASISSASGRGGYQVSGEFADIGGALTSESYESFSSSGVDSGVVGIDGGLAGAESVLGSIAGGIGGGYSQYIDSQTGIAGFEGGALLSEAAAGGIGSQYSSYESQSYGGIAAGTESAAISGAGYGVESSAESGLTAYSAGGAVGGYGAGYGGVSGAGPLLPLNLYRVQRDSNPTVITRALAGGASVYRQNINIRFLKPPTPPAPGPLIIKEVRPPQPRPAPPIIIRQRAPRPKTPPPIVLRERPPAMPLVQKTKVVVRKLAALPPPERQVIIERYRALPPKPQDIIIERWIPYGKMPKRRVIVQKAARQSAYRTKKNLIIEYVPGPVRKERIIRNLGIINANPLSYISRYGSSLLESHSLVSSARRLGIIENISPPIVVHAAGFSGEEFVGTGLGGSGSLVAYGGGVEGASSSFESYESNLIGGGVEGFSGYETGSGIVGLGNELGVYGQSLYSSGNQYGLGGLSELGGSSSYQYSSSGLTGGAAVASGLQSAEISSEVGGVEGASSAAIISHGFNIRKR
ncbi:hypothetical protein GJ496_010209 [Pomphorhynchus laevis]|nr:hypothetical protein GJ496_010209 [Pomphorhynchus laevis]